MDDIDDLHPHRSREQSEPAVGSIPPLRPGQVIVRGVQRSALSSGNVASCRSWSAERQCFVDDRIEWSQTTHAGFSCQSGSRRDDSGKRSSSPRSAV